MGFPDRIERTISVAQPPETVWAAITTAEGLGTWFGQKATVDLRVGGLAQLTWDGGFTAELHIERLDPPRVFGWTWAIVGLPEGDPRRTYVEFTLEPDASGTRLTMVETGFAQLPVDSRRATYDSHAEGWANELGDLADYLDDA